MKIRGVILDVDGTLTDGKKHYFETSTGFTILKSFSVRDGKGVDLIQKTGVKVAIITADKWELIIERAKDMGIEDVFYDSHDKIGDAQKFCAKYGFSLSDICFVGDDVNDIPLLEKVGLPIAVGDAMDSVKSVCAKNGGHIMTATGGNGAVREAMELIMEKVDEKN